MPGAGVTIVVPVYRGQDTLPELVRRVVASLPSTPLEMILVDDGSPDSSWQVIKDLAASDERVLGLRLGRNVGQHGALLAGIREARFPLLVTLDDDLQNPPEEIPTLLKVLSDSDVDLVYGTPPVVAQPGWRKFGSRSLRAVLNRSLGVADAESMSSFRAFRTDLRGGFASPLGPKISIDALLAWSTSRTTSIEVRHDSRGKGRSGYTLKKLFAFAVDTITGYSAAPLQFALALGLATGLLGLALLAFIIVKFLVDGSQVPGFTFLAAALTLFSGVQLTTLGIIGEYIARVHFRVMGKPTYRVAQVTSRRP